MATATKTALGQTIDRVKRAWTEMDLAQRRLFEIRTGVPVIERDVAPHSARTVEQLDALYESDDDQLAA